MTDAILCFEKVHLTRQDCLVFENLSYGFEKGRSYALMGPNGCGKSSFLHVALGLVIPQKGTCTLLGTCPKKAQERTAYLPEKLTFFLSLTAVDLVRALSANHAHRLRARDLLRQLSFNEALYQKPLKALSKGSYQKVLLSLCLTAEKELYLLDEPTAGLDPSSIEKTLAVIEDLCRSGRTVLFTTHSDEEARAAHIRLSLRSHRLFPLENKRDIYYYKNT